MSETAGPGKIVHLCLACFYIDGYAYQENLLPRAHQRRGWDVEIIASLLNFGPDGRLFEEASGRQYRNEDGIMVRRIPYGRWPLARRLRTYRGLRRHLNRSSPDVLFVHGPQFLDALTVVRYAQKNPDVRMFVDNHADLNNSAKGWIGRHLLHGIVWRWVARALDTKAVRFYGVLPSRVDFLTDVYRLPPSRVTLLPLGADDLVVQKIEACDNDGLRESFGLPRGRKLLVTGGKIDENKPEILHLMEAFTACPQEWELAVFGNVVDAYRDRFEKLVEAPRVHSLGWLSPERSMQLMACADIVAFPGLHSVMWEQAVALGKPLMVRRVAGTQHLDLGGNVLVLASGSVDDIAASLLSLDADPDLLPSLTRGATAPERKGFLYGGIADASVR